MKKIILLALCIVLLLCGCGSGKPAPTVAPAGDVYVGMPAKELDKFYGPDEIVAISIDSVVTFAYYFMKDTNGNPMVVTVEIIDGTYQITSMVAYDKNAIDFSKKNFYSIEAGMTVQDVIALVGMPSGCYSSYGDELTWWFEQWKFGACVVVQEHPDDAKVFIVKDVKMIEENDVYSILGRKYNPFVG